jgi:hypothetical protein
MGQNCVEIMNLLGKGGEDFSGGLPFPLHPLCVSGKTTAI